jgi:hypothetical protein
MGPSDDSLGLTPLPKHALTGDEPFVGVAAATVRDFWSFALSDLQSNVTRGVLAEFLVARAVGAKENLRATWDNYDVTAPDGTRIEVKSAAYLQSWRQQTHSPIRFTGLSGLSWDDETGWGDSREIRADVFVFGIQTCRTHADFDPLETGQWEWYVVPARSVAENGSRSVGIGFLERHTSGPIPYEGIADAVKQARSDATAEPQSRSEPSAPGT